MLGSKGQFNISDKFKHMKTPAQHVSDMKQEIYTNIIQVVLLFGILTIALYIALTYWSPVLPT